MPLTPLQKEEYILRQKALILKRFRESKKDQKQIVQSLTQEIKNQGYMQNIKEACKEAAVKDGVGYAGINAQELSNKIAPRIQQLLTQTSREKVLETVRATLNTDKIYQEEIKKDPSYKLFTVKKLAKKEVVVPKPAVVKPVVVEKCSVSDVSYKITYGILGSGSKINGDLVGNFRLSSKPGANDVIDMVFNGLQVPKLEINGMVLKPEEIKFANKRLVINNKNLVAGNNKIKIRFTNKSDHQQSVAITEDNAYPFFDNLAVVPEIGVLVLAPSTWAATGDNQQPTSNFKKGEPGIKPVLEKFEVSPNSLGIFMEKQYQTFEFVNFRNPKLEFKRSKSFMVANDPEVLKFVELQANVWNGQQGSYSGQMNGAGMRHGYGRWQGKTGETLFGDWLLDQLVKGTIIDKAGKAKTINQGGALQSKHTNKTECDVALKLVSDIHAKAALKKEQIRFEVENINMAIEGDLKIRIWNLLE